MSVLFQGISSISFFFGMSSKFFFKHLLPFHWLQPTQYTFLVYLQVNSCIFFCFLRRDIPFCWCYHIYQFLPFLFLFYNYYIWPICHNFSISTYTSIPVQLLLQYWLGCMQTILLLVAVLQNTRNQMRCIINCLATRCCSQLLTDDTVIENMFWVWNKPRERLRPANQIK